MIYVKYMKRGMKFCFILMFIVAFLFISLSFVSVVSASCKFPLQLREHKDCTIYNPDITFSKIAGQDALRASSTDSSLGNAYAFAVFDKSFLNGKKIRINWTTVASGSYNDVPFTLSILDGTYSRTSDTDFFPSDYSDCGQPLYKGEGMLQVFNGTFNINKIDTVTINIENTGLDKVTFFVTWNDAWDQASGTMDIFSLEILDINNNVLRYADLSGNLNMEQTGTYADHGIIGTDTCVQTCPSNQTIMKLSSSTNAHGALWDDATGYYNYNVCYSDIFGSEYTGANLHTCSGNRVLSLSAPFNAHASVNSTPDYLTNVCYGNLICHSTTEGCSASEEIVVRLKQEINSHISNASDTNYPIKICCKPGITSTVTGTYWANMNGMAINTADLNDKVKLIVEGSELAGDINYTVYKNNPWWLDKKVAQGSSAGFTTWRAGKKSDGTLSEGNYYFKVKVGGVEYSTLDNPNINYRELAVSSPQSNSKPIVNITSPKDRQMYFLLENLNFTASITDEDDDFDYTWDLGNGVKKSGNSITWNDYRFFYAYNTENQKDIVLTATDERGASSRAQVSILIINESSYALAYIDEPRFGEAYGRIVDFNASGSYVVNSTYNTDGTRKITCLAGNCPSQTEGCPPPGTGCHIPVEETPKSLDAVNFYWIFDNGVKTKNKTGALGGHQFTEMFASTGEHTAELTINFNPFSTTRTKFGVYFDDPTCVIEENENNVKSYWYEGTSITESSDNCYRENGIGINGNPGTDCCIPGEQCNSEGNCVPGGIGCEQFTEDTSCEQDGGTNAESILKSIVNCNEPDNFGTSGTCWNMTRCQCEWISESEGCRAVAENVIWHQDGETYEEWTYTNAPQDIGVICEGGNAGSLGDCKFNFLTTDNCENTGFIERSWTIGWTPPPTEETPKPSWCSNGSDEIPCIGVAKLAFFTIVGLIAAIVLIVIIYIIIVSKKKKYSKKRTGKEKTIKRKKRI